MRTSHGGRLISGLLAAVIAVGCSGSVAQAPDRVRTALQPFVETGYICRGPSTDNSAYSQWACDLTTDDGTALHILIDADSTRIKQVLAVIDQSKDKTTDVESVSAFFDKVAQTDLGATPAQVTEWIGSHIPGGGQEHIGPVFVTLDAFRPVCTMSLFVET